MRGSGSRPLIANTHNVASRDCCPVAGSLAGVCVSWRLCSRGACSGSAGPSGLLPDQSPLFKRTAVHSRRLSARKGWPPRPGLRDEANEPINWNEGANGERRPPAAERPPPPVRLLPPRPVDPWHVPGTDPRRVLLTGRASTTRPSSPCGGRPPHRPAQPAICTHSLLATQVHLCPPPPSSR